MRDILSCWKIIDIGPHLALNLFKLKNENTFGVQSAQTAMGEMVNFARECPSNIYIVCRVIDVHLMNEKFVFSVEEQHTFFHPSIQSSVALFQHSKIKISNTLCLRYKYNKI